jgi:hypothetical protein
MQTVLLIANGPVDYLCSSDGRELAGKVRRWALTAVLLKKFMKQERGSVPVRNSCPFWQLHTSV